MTPEQTAQIRAAARQAAHTTAAEQHLPVRLTDKATIDTIATLFRDAAELKDVA